MTARLEEAALLYPSTDDAPARGLHPTTLSLSPGTITAVIGGNGAGKSTLLNLITTARPPTAGRVLIAGHAIDHDSPLRTRAAARRELSCAFALPMLDPLLTGHENLDLAARLVSIPIATARKAAKEIANALGVADRLSDRVARLSTGLARRVDLTRALLNPSKLLVLDEPTGPLDEPGRQALHRILQSRAKNGSTVVISTHDQNEALAADETACLHAGRLAAIISRSELTTSLQRTIIRWSDAPDRAEDRLECPADEEAAGSFAAKLIAEGKPHRVSRATLADIPAMLAQRRIQAEDSP